MFGLPEETVLNLPIPADKIFLRAIRIPSLQKSYDEQVRGLYWRNKLSTQSCGIKYTGFFQELEILESQLHMKTLDKRILGAIDKAVPYYTFHVLTWDHYCRAMIADKRYDFGEIKVENYLDSGWMDFHQFRFVFEERSLDKLYSSLKEQVRAKNPQKLITARQSEKCRAFISYCQTMKMTRSYKPVLIIATLEYGGCITVSQAANYFLHYYQSRKKKGLPPEFGTCIYAEENPARNAVFTNLTQNPIKALCNSGLFEYNKGENVFSVLPDIYDGLSLNEIDKAILLCRQRLDRYFNM